jgi:streptomycin 3"-adenylyltransferase
VTVTDPLDEAATAQATAVVECVRAVLGDDALGIYLYGSAVAGGLRRDSDLDLFVVSRRPTALVEKAALVEAITPVSHRPLRPAGWRPVELTIVVDSSIRPWRFPPEMDFQYGEWLRDDFAAGLVAPAQAVNPDLAILVSMVRQCGRALLGPPPAEVLDPVPRTDLVRAMLEGVDGLLADLEPDTRNVLLTLARIWSSLETGEIVGKDAAAARAVQRLPPELRPAMEVARVAYLGEAADDWTKARAAAHELADWLVVEIRRSVTASGGQ